LLHEGGLQLTPCWYYSVNKAAIFSCYYSICLMAYAYDIVPGIHWKYMLLCGQCTADTEFTLKLLLTLLLKCGHRSLVSDVTPLGWTSRVSYPWRAGIFSSLSYPDWLGLTQVAVQWVLGALFLGVKWP
jgi:hypothetical protein